MSDTKKVHIIGEPVAWAYFAVREEDYETFRELTANGMPRAQALTLLELSGEAIRVLNTSNRAYEGSPVPLLVDPDESPSEAEA